jgi:plasmid maintenance system antidote protein VapI
MSTEELKAIIVDIGSVSAAARAAGCDRAYIRQCRNGKRPISQKIADRLRAAMGVTTGPLRSPTRP